MSKKIIFVCRENLNRSPTAARILEHRLAAAGAQAKICSAGYEIRGGKGNIDYRLDRTMIKRGYGTLVNHRPMELDEIEIGKGDILLAMGPRQAKAIAQSDALSSIKGISGMIHSLPAYVGDAELEIVDPNRYVLDVIRPYNNRKYSKQAAVAGRLPVLLARPFLHCFANGRVDNRDKEGIDDLFARMVNQIEFYVERAIPRLVGEGYIFKKGQTFAF